MKKKYCVASFVCFMLFAVLILLIKFADVAAIGPEGSQIGLSGINGAFQNAFPFNERIYEITEITGYISLAFIGVFALLGLYQLISRKSLKKIDCDIYLLAGFYAAVIAFYVAFEVVVINYRPVLEDGALAASFPSSHTLLAVCIMLSSAHQISKRVKTSNLKLAGITFCTVIMLITVIGRLFSGVHWLTDIMGGVLLSLALFFAYLAVYKKITE